MMRNLSHHQLHCWPHDSRRNGYGRSPITLPMIYLARSLPIFLASIASIICVIVVFHVPWVRPNILVDRGVYEISVSIDIGLFKCYSDICEKYAKSELMLALPPISVPRIPIPIKLPTESPSVTNSPSTSTEYLSSSMPSASGTARSSSPSANQDPDFPSKFPPSAGSIPSRFAPTIGSAMPAVSPAISPIFMPSNTAPPIIHVPDSKRDKVLREAAEKPFFVATVYVVALLMVNAVLCTFSVSISLYHFCREGVIRYNGQLLLLIAAMCFNSLAVAIYICITLFYLNGGYYIDGVWITSLMSITGLLCILVSFAADVEIKSNNYSRIPDAQIQMHSTGVNVSVSHHNHSAALAVGTADNISSHHPQPPHVSSYGSSAASGGP